MPYFVAPIEQTHVPMLFWASEGFFVEKRLDRAALESLSAQEYSHDNVFHSMLGLFDVHTSVYERSLDLFAPARTDS